MGIDPKHRFDEQFQSIATDFLHTYTEPSMNEGKPVLDGLLFE